MDRRELLALEKGSFGTPPRTPKHGHGESKRFPNSKSNPDFQNEAYDKFRRSRRSMSPPRPEGEQFQNQPSTNLRSISIPPPPPNLNPISTTAYTSLSITNAPSRNSLVEPNVFSTPGGNPANFHQRKRARKGGGGGGERIEYGSLLNRLDASIRRIAGDWRGVDEEDFGGTNMNNRRHRHNNIEDINGGGGGGGGGRQKNGTLEPLPHIYKSYRHVMQNKLTSVPNDSQESYSSSYSRDNRDPNSILNEAKRTLNQLK